MPGPDKRKKPLRTPDGRPELRSVEQMMRQAAEAARERLPGKGKKLDLQAYFRSGPEHRVATRLLKDNGILPQGLADRKEAESAFEEAAKLLETRESAMVELESDIERHAGIVAQYIGGRAEFEAILGVPWPGPLSPRESRPSRTEAAEALRLLEDLTRRLKLKRTDTLAKYSEALIRANEASDRCHQQFAATGRLLPLVSHVPRVDIETATRQAEDRLPCPTDLPSAAVERLGRRFRRRWISQLFSRGT